MFGFDHEDIDGDLCPHCEYVIPREVGMGPFKCPECGGDLYQPRTMPDHLPDDDVLLDDRYITFNPIKAFRILRDLGRLGECEYESPD